jgi:hypothetical protein
VLEWEVKQSEQGRVVLLANVSLMVAKLTREQHEMIRMAIKQENLERDIGKQIMSEQHKWHDDLFTEVRFSNETYASIEVSQRTESLPSLSNDSTDRAWVLSLLGWETGVSEDLHTIWSLSLALQLNGGKNSKLKSTRMQQLLLLNYSHKAIGGPRNLPEPGQR